MILLTFPLLPFHLSLSLSLYRYQQSTVRSPRLIAKIASLLSICALICSLSLSLSLTHTHTCNNFACIHCIAFRFPYSSSVCNASFQLIAPMFRFIYQRFKFPNTSLRWACLTPWFYLFLMNIIIGRGALYIPNALLPQFPLLLIPPLSVRVRVFTSLPCAVALPSALNFPPHLCDAVICISSICVHNVANKVAVATFTWMVTTGNY